MKVGLQVIHVISLGTIRPQFLANRFELDPILAQKILVLFETVNEVPLLEPLFPAPWWLRRYDSTFYFGFDAVGARLVLIASDLALLAKNAAGPASELHGRRVVDGLLLVRLMMLRVLLCHLARRYLVGYMARILMECGMWV